MDIKENFAANLIKYRKALGITQAELAEKINYSDKAVSKWERAESLPDLVVVKSIADLFGITIDALISEPTPEKPKISVMTNKRRSITYLIAFCSVWLIAICAYVFLDLIVPEINRYWQTWLALIYALPISFVVVFIFTSVWKSKILNTIFSSLFVWTLLLAIYLSLVSLLPDPSPLLWEIFLIGIPVQALIIFFFFYKKIKFFDKKSKK